MNVSESDIPGASFYETYRPRFDVTRLFSRGIVHSVYIIRAFSRKFELYEMYVFGVTVVLYPVTSRFLNAR